MTLPWEDTRRHTRVGRHRLRATRRFRGSRATLRHAGRCFQTTDFWPARRPESCAPGRKADTLRGPIPPGSACPAPGGGGGGDWGGGKNTKPELHLGLGPPGRRGKYRVLSPRRGCRMRVRMTRGKKNPEFFTLKRENKTCVLSCVFSLPEKTKDGKPGTVFARQLSGNIPKRPSLDFYSSLAVGRPEQRNIIHAFSCLHMLLLSHPQAAQADSRTCLPDIKSSSLA